jgi:hypothetical protein
MDETFVCMESLGYFAVALYNHPVSPSVPEPLRRNAEISVDLVEEMISISSGIHGVCKRGSGQAMIDEALRLAHSHENMKATEPPHRHDQALLTLLLYKHFGSPILSDYHIYAHHDPSGPGRESLQKIWVHRRKLTEEDKAHFAKYLHESGGPYRPTDRAPSAQRPGFFKRLRISIAKLRGRYPGNDWVDLDRTVLHGLKD